MTKEEIRKSMMLWFIIGWVCIIFGYMFFMLAMPKDYLAYDWLQRYTTVSTVMFISMAIGGIFCLLGFIKLIDYFKYKEAESE